MFAQARQRFGKVEQVERVLRADQHDAGELHRRDHAPPRQIFDVERAAAFAQQRLVHVEEGQPHDNQAK